MKRHRGVFVLVALALAALMAGCWGSSKSTSVDVGTVPIEQAGRVGTQSCINECHAATTDITGTQIAAAWGSPANVHTQQGNVQCEDCHGGGQFHFGIGPIPFPNPRSDQCLVCHGPGGNAPTIPTAFNDTAHANRHVAGGPPGPDRFFAQGDAGTGQATQTKPRSPALPHPEFRPDNVTPVTKGQYIEECSRCHNPNQRFEYGPDAVLIRPNPASMPNPEVSCAGCHDAHFAENETSVPQRGAAGADFPVFRQNIVDNTGAIVDNTEVGAHPLRAFIFQPNGAVKANGTLDNSSVVGTNNELNIESLCAACHTVGLYKYERQPTHQTNAYTQWTRSGHGNRNAPAFAEFSANPPAYTNPNTGLPYDLGEHQTSYPFDMALSQTNAAGPATTTRNAGSSNFACFKCHHGLGSLAYQDNVEGTPAASVLFGDETVTCVTCHDPHTNVPGQGKNTRKPLVMSKYNAGGLVFSGNVFFDNTPVPAGTGNATICVFCHQGRESGFTLHKRRLVLDNQLAGSFLNPHYLGTGAMLWGKNGYEYADNTLSPREYGVNVPHQNTNCFGCHMAPAKAPDNTVRDDLGGHTWRIVNEEDNTVNNTTCNQAACHNGRVPATNAGGEFDDFSDNVVGFVGDFDGNGTFQGIPIEIAGLENNVIALFLSKGVEYRDTEYPYFFIPGTDNAFTAWTRPLLKAAFNLSFVIKGLPSGPSQIGQPNTSAATHNYRYNIQLLHDSYEDLYRDSQANGPAIPAGLPAPEIMARPTGTRPATNYDPQPGGGYSPRQAFGR